MSQHSNRPLRVFLGPTTAGQLSESRWLPTLASVLHDELTKTPVDAVTSMMVASRDDVAFLELSASASIAELLQQVRQALHSDERPLEPVTDIAYVWRCAHVVGDAVLLLADLPVELPEDAEPPLGLRYMPYGAELRRPADEIYDAVETFEEVHAARFGFLPEVACASRQTVEEVEAEQARHDRMMEIIMSSASLSGSQHDEVEIEHDKDRAEIASETGFTGTLRAFLDWLRSNLVCGTVRVSQPVPDDWGQLRFTVETVTGGYSSDEHLLGRVDRLPQFRSAWRSSHAGGLTVYEFSYDQLDSTWLVELKPEGTEPFEVFARARTLKVEHPDGVYIASFERGVELVFEEPDRDIVRPDGVLTVRSWNSSL